MKPIGIYPSETAALHVLSHIERFWSKHYASVDGVRKADWLIDQNVFDYDVRMWELFVTTNNVTSREARAFFTVIVRMAEAMAQMEKENKVLFPL